MSRSSRDAATPAGDGSTPVPAARGGPGMPTLVDVVVVLAVAYVLAGVVTTQASAQLDGALAEAVALTSFGLVMGVATVGWVLARRGPDGLRGVLGPRPAWRHLAVAATVGAGAGVVLNVALPPLLEVVLDQVGLDPPTVQQTHRQVLTAPDSRLVAAAGVLMIAPLGEELVFRGLAFRALRQRLAAAAAVPVSALLFAGMHVAGADPLGAAFLVVTLGLVGVALAVLVERQQHLWGAVVGHAFFNGVGVAIIVTA